MASDITHLQWALTYARNGLSVYPTRGKKPFMKGGFHLATTDEAKIRKWWKRWPNADVSLAAMPNFWVLDVDVDSGGFDSLAKLEAKHVPLPETLTQRSGGGGLHYLFQPLPRLKNIAGGSVKWWPYGGLDILTQSILAAPSIHPDTGAMYEWAHDGPENRPAIAEAPGWLKTLVTPPPEPAYRAVPVDDVGLDRLVDVALKEAIACINAAEEGCRWYVVNRQAFSVGRLVQGKSRQQAPLFRVLLNASLSLPNDESWTRKQARDAVTIGFNDGIKKGRFNEKIALQRR